MSQRAKSLKPLIEFLKEKSRKARETEIEIIYRNRMLKMNNNVNQRPRGNNNRNNVHNGGS